MCISTIRQNLDYYQLMKWCVCICDVRTYIYAHARACCTSHTCIHTSHTCTCPCTCTHKHTHVHNYQENYITMYYNTILCTMKIRLHTVDCSHVSVSVLVLVNSA